MSSLDKIKKAWAQTQDDMSRGRAAEIVYDKLHPEKIDDKFELSKKLAKANAIANRIREDVHPGLVATTAGIANAIRNSQ